MDRKRDWRKERNRDWDWREGRVKELGRINWKKIGEEEGIGIGKKGVKKIGEKDGNSHDSWNM